VRAIELTPPLGSPTFATLPTAAPGLFELNGCDVRRVNFDLDPGGNAIASGTSLSAEYAPAGVLMNSILVSNNVWQGAASAPNATFHHRSWSGGPVFDFLVPVAAAGVINTSPDSDWIEFWSGPNATGALLLRFQDQAGQPINWAIDRFVGGRVLTGPSIASMRVLNGSGDLELDELVFEVASTAQITYGLGCAGSGGFVPVLTTCGCPMGGLSISIELLDALGGSAAAVFGGFGRASSPLTPGCDLLLAPPMFTLGFQIPIAGSGPGAGACSFPLAVPPGYAGLAINLQAAVLDPPPFGFVVTGGVEVVIQ
jgi:hypothetical protein